MFLGTGINKINHLNVIISFVREKKYGLWFPNEVVYFKLLDYNYKENEISSGTFLKINAIFIHNRFLVVKFKRFL